MLILLRQKFLVFYLTLLEKQSIELWFDGANGNIFAITAFIATVVVSTAIQFIGLSVGSPHIHRH